MTDPRVTKATIEAAVSAFDPDYAGASSVMPAFYAAMDRALTAALAVIDRERPEPSDAVLEAMDRARDPEWWATLDANGGNLTPAGKVITYGRITTMRRALIAQAALSQKKPK